MARVFVYGTLKKGQPNYQHMLNGTHGIAKFQGRGRTVEKYPLVIADEGKGDSNFCFNREQNGILGKDNGLLLFLE
ncbi:gamma-glutamylaminecyclotransferase isoform X2 [Lepidochelys kempii]|uniref:gamma-glutamylaminecyclotransferase isoform X2 n=1 Tax=Lepidochelys kempii TaxID=8472 RepID=UPI003C6FBB18